MINFQTFFTTCIKDNTKYFLTYQENDSYAYAENGKLSSKKITISHYYSKWQDDRDMVHPALAQLAAELSEKLQDDSFIEKYTYLFNKEAYEHNTRDAFIQYFNPAKVPALNGASLITGNLVGFVSKRIKNNLFSLKISSRFGNKFLLSMIADADGFLELEDYGDINQQGWAEWLLIFLWKTKLKAAYRLGLPKEYVSTKELLHRVRGNINIDHWLKNLEHYPAYRCDYRAHSYDNAITRLINKTFHTIENKQLITDCSRIHHDFLIATQDKKIATTQLLKSNNLKNPYYSVYKDVVRLSKMLLRRQTGDFNDDQNDMSAFLFDISMLFEHFLRKALIREGYRLEEKNLTTHLISRGNGGRRALKPDIVIRNQSNQLELFEVKYKHFSFSEGVNREDLYQLHTYLGYFLHQEDVRRCGFIYPIAAEILEGKPSVLRNKIFQSGKIIDFEIHFFVVPAEQTDTGENEIYYAAFRRNITDFLASFKTK